MATSEDLASQLQAIAGSSEFAYETGQLTERWPSAGVGIEGVDAILSFMEMHPDLDFGAPGHLVHFAEQFYRNGYEDKLVASVERRPTDTTIGMLNRLINGTSDPKARGALIALMRSARANPAADDAVLETISFYLEYQEQ